MEFPVIFRCNNNCISCVLDNRLASKKDDPPWRLLKKAIDRVSDSDKMIGITGGEPTISGNFFRLMSYVRDTRPDKYVFLVTNARMFSYPEFAKRFSDLKIRNLRVGSAIYSHHPEIHDLITMTKGSWRQTIDGIKNLLKVGIRIELRIIVNKLNYSSMCDTARFITKTLPSVDRVVFINMKYTGSAFRNRKEVFVTYRELVPSTTKAVDILQKADISVRLFHFPLCTLPEDYRGIAKGITKQKGELIFTKTCKTCKSREDCPMIWKSYLVLAGEGEFMPI